MEKICKSFGANNVLTEVNFSLAAGEICALLGENGAGYFAFQIFVEKENVKTITIPAGTRFPSRAISHSLF